MKKLKIFALCAALTIAIVLGICSVPALAATDGAELESSGELAAPSSEGGEAPEDGATDTDGGVAYGENPFELLWDGLLEHTEPIMCALTLVGSLVLTYLYKKGLIPFLTRALTAINSAISGIKESTEVYAQRSGKDISDISAALGRSESVIGTIGERLDAIETALGEANGAREQSEAMRAVMSMQVELLYDILMNSAIPQYRKDAAGERLLEMKSALVAHDVAEE